MMQETQPPKTERKKKTPPQLPLATEEAAPGAPVDWLPEFTESDPTDPLRVAKVPRKWAQMHPDAFAHGQEKLKEKFRGRELLRSTDRFREFIIYKKG